MKTFSILIVVGLFFAGILHIAAQNCGCPSGNCCSQYGYCGTAEDYCGTGCQQGPCSGRSPSIAVTIATIVNDSFFDGIKAQSSDPSCEGRDFYTRAAFLDAVENYPEFGRADNGTDDDLRREIAAFFAHVTYQIGSFCNIKAINPCPEDCCDKSNTTYPCNPNKSYYGRGPLQLSWNYNYGPAGISIGFDGLNNPEIVAMDPFISFRVALWFWMANVHHVLQSGQGFGATIRKVGGDTACDGVDTSNNIGTPVWNFIEYCKQLGVSPGHNLRC